MVTPKPLLTVRSLRDGRKTTAKMGNPAKVLESMDWEVLDPSGKTLGYLAGEPAAKMVSRLAELHRLLIEVGAYHHLKARFDNGYLDIPVEMLRDLEKLLAP